MSLFAALLCSILVKSTLAYDEPAFGDCDYDEDSIIRDIMSNYTRNKLPDTRGVTVEVEIGIVEISEISEMRSEFEVDIFFSEVWTDPALAYASRCFPNLTLNLEYLMRVWQPTVCVVNSKESFIHQSPWENIFLILYSSGKVWRNCRMRVKAPCEIDLKNFPFDTQPCSLVFESYVYNSAKVRLKWFDTAPVKLLKPTQLPDFVLIGNETAHAQMPYPNGVWDQLKVTFYFKRQYGFFVLQAYVPTYMVIFVAWINFWMDPRELSTRATLAISAFLAMTLQFGNIIQNMPKVSYVKAIDVWMLGGILFLFICLAELAIISYMLRGDVPKKNLQTTRLDHGQKAMVIAELRRKQKPGTFCKGRITPFHVDFFCLFTFPPLFLIFNIFYWGFYVAP